MSLKSILIWVVIIVIIGIGGYFAYTTFMNAPQENTQANADQVQIQEVAAGTGAEATPGSSVSVLYEGRLQDGTVFDSSAAHNNEPLVFTLGSPGIIPGFQIGVNGMKVGGERLMVVPPSLGYGAQEVKDPDGKVIVPANSTLAFNVKLVAVNAAATTTATTTEQTETTTGNQ